MLEPVSGQGDQLLSRLHPVLQALRQATIAEQPRGQIAFLQYLRQLEGLLKIRISPLGERGSLGGCGGDRFFKRKDAQVFEGYGELPAVAKSAEHLF